MENRAQLLSGIKLDARCLLHQRQPERLYLAGIALPTPVEKQQNQIFNPKQWKIKLYKKIACGISHKRFEQGVVIMLGLNRAAVSQSSTPVRFSAE